MIDIYIYILLTSAGEYEDDEERGGRDLGVEKKIKKGMEYCTNEQCV